MHNKGNKVHSKCKAVEFSRNHPSLPPTIHGKNCLPPKTHLWCQKVEGHCSKGSMILCVCPSRIPSEAKTLTGEFKPHAWAQADITPGNKNLAGLSTEGEPSHLRWEGSSPAGRAINMPATSTNMTAHLHTHTLGSNDTPLFFQVKWTVLNLLTESITDYLKKKRKKKRKEKQYQRKWSPRKEQ